MHRGHPMFDNEHNAGQHSTLHRPVESARQRAMREGKHPEHGQFQREFPNTPEEWANHDPSRKVYRAPSGDNVVIQHHETPVGTKPHDRKVSVNGQEMFESAAREYVGRRHGIHF